jgi:hypothetical protein
MKVSLVRYRVHPDRIAENEELIAGVYRALHEIRPSGLRYATFRVGDGADFVHIAAVEAGAQSHPLTSQPAFQRFSSGIADRCEVPPVVVELDEVGSYEFDLR